MSLNGRLVLLVSKVLLSLLGRLRLISAWQGVARHLASLNVHLGETQLLLSLLSLMGLLRHDIRRAAQAQGVARCLGPRLGRLNALNDLVLVLK